MTSAPSPLEPDRVVLARFVQMQDEHAFATLVHRYADDVFATCLRVLRDHARAEDATQETFYRLCTRTPGDARHLGAWLHRVACRVSIDIQRSESRRRTREFDHGRSRTHAEPADAGWAELSPHVDAAIDELPDPLRVVLVEHFLRQRTLTDIAADQRVSKATMSRRLKTALQRLHRTLEQRGVTLGLTATASLLATSVAHAAAPASTLMELNKLAMVSGATGATQAGTASAVGHWLGAHQTALLATTTAGLATFGIVAVFVFTAPAPANDPHESRTHHPQTTELVTQHDEPPTADTPSTSPPPSLPNAATPSDSSHLPVREDTPPPAPLPQRDHDTTAPDQASQASYPPAQLDRPAASTDSNQQAPPAPPRRVEDGTFLRIDADLQSLDSQRLAFVQHPDLISAGRLSVAYGDGRTESLKPEEIDQALRRQTGESLESIASDTARHVRIEQP
ncbi:MAG: sigma-70 family RNA polymerase sigma factor [Planctomycetota bacterium]